MEYTAEHLKRQVVHFMVVHAKFFLKFCWKSILFIYNLSNLAKGFSFRGYLEYLLERDTWGDEVVIAVCSMMWDLPASVLYPSLQEFKIRHSHRDLEQVGLIVLYTGGVHYSAIGK